MSIKNSLAPVGRVSLMATLLLSTTKIAHAQDGSTADSAVAGAFIFFAVLILIFLAVAVGFFIFWIIMLIDAFQRTNWQDDNQKTLWYIVLIASFFMSLYWLSAILYYILVKKALDKNPVQTVTARPVKSPPTKK